MSTIIRRVLIVAALVVLIGLIVQKYNAPGTSGVQLNQDEMKRLLKETVERIWTAMENADWLTVYESFSPKLKQRLPLANFMQDKTMLYFKNWAIQDIQVEDLRGTAKVKHDWGVKLPMKIDLGKPEKIGVVRTDFYEFDPETGAWYFTGTDTNTRLTKK